MNAIAPGMYERKYMQIYIYIYSVEEIFNVTADGGYNFVGYVKTDLTDALVNDPVRSKEILGRIPAKRWGNPDDFKGPIVYLASRASDYVSGEIMAVDGGWLGKFNNILNNYELQDTHWLTCNSSSSRSLSKINWGSSPSSDVFTIIHDRERERERIWGLYTA